MIIQLTTYDIYPSDDKTENRCPVSHPFSFLQNNLCCSTKTEATTTINQLKANCNGGNLRDESICCTGITRKCPNKPCFNNLPNLGEKNDNDRLNFQIFSHLTDVNNQQIFAKFIAHSKFFGQGYA